MATNGPLFTDPSIAVAMDRYRQNTLSAEPVTKPAYTPETKLAVRLNCSSYSLPFDRIAFHQLDDKTMLIWVVNKGDHVVLEDDLSLFPSDKLITQLRLLK